MHGYQSHPQKYNLQKYNPQKYNDSEGRREQERMWKPPLRKCTLGPKIWYIRIWSLDQWPNLVCIRITWGTFKKFWFLHLRMVESEFLGVRLENLWFSKLSHVIRKGEWSILLKNDRAEVASPPLNVQEVNLKSSSLKRHVKKQASYYLKTSSIVCLCKADVDAL